MPSQTDAGDSPPPPMTRAQVARRLGTHVTTVRRLERAAKLHPTRNAHGVWLFDPREVEQIAVARSLDGAGGVIAARVFKALRDGFSLRDIVIACELSPDVVQRLYADWLAMESPARASALRLAAATAGDKRTGRSTITPSHGDPESR